jgi:hypothetical protein
MLFQKCVFEFTAVPLETHTFVSMRVKTVVVP